MTYTLIKKENFDKLGLEVSLFEHEKTKAQIIYIDNDDTNKTFGIGFKSPPTDSKGKAHIMEHSVLNGSKKYRSKDPFMDMAASSLQTFLNAMTYPDKTLFPVASENDRDFKNLVDVYLDAVFNPLVLEKKEILDQEAWHYDLKDGQVNGISGVVYNEMKGALSDPESLISNQIDALLFKDSPYQYVSGGDPTYIKDLSYDEFIEFYKDTYHPSNAMIYFYGKLDIDSYLEYLDEEYLSNYSYRKIDKDIVVKENSYPELIESTYPSSKLEEDSAYLTYGFLATSSLDLKDYLTLNILVNTLFNSDSSKIRTRIAKEINPELFYARVGYGNRSSVIIQAQKADPKKIDDFVEIIEEGMREFSLNLSEESLKSAFSIFDYGQRESLNSVNRGISYLTMINPYGDLFDVFRMVDVLDDLRKLIGSGYYEQFIKDHFLDNKTRLIHIAKANLSYAEEKNKAFEKYLKEKNDSLKSKDLESIKDDLDKLKAYQDRENTKEEKASIPRLNIEDVPVKIKDIPREVEDDSFEFIYHDLKTSGLIYVSLYFALDHMNLEELQYLSLVNELLGAVDTENIAYTQIDDILWQHLSGLNFSLVSLRVSKEESENKLKVSFKTTRESLDKALDLVKDFMLKSKFKQKDRIFELLKMKKSIFEASMYDRGHMIALARADSHIDKQAYIKEKLSGLDSYFFLKEAINMAKDNFDLFKEKLSKAYKKSLSRNLSVNITSSRKDYKLAKKAIKENFDFLEEEDRKISIDFKATPLKEAILSDGNVNYVAESLDLKDQGLSYKGYLTLAGSILSNPYLYELIRAKGGAYGAGMAIDKNLILKAFSYRDPNIGKTLDNYKKIGSITKNLDLDQRDFENQQISTMGSILRPQTPNQYGQIDYINYKNKDFKDPEEILKEIKEADLKEIKDLGEVFDKAFEVDNVAVFGNRESILKEKDYFDRIIDIND
ncbi:MAG: insulinase family protein [Anaerococcus sp.]|nr:insulinase family protein [Anaerococcus sp.]